MDFKVFDRSLFVLYVFVFSNNTYTVHIGTTFQYCGLIIFLIFSIFSQILVCQLNRRHSVDNFWIRKEINFVNFAFVIILVIFLISYTFISDSCTRVLIISYAISLSEGIASIGVIYAVSKLKDKNTKSNSNKNNKNKNKNNKYNRICPCELMCIKVSLVKDNNNTNTALEAISATRSPANNPIATTASVPIERTSTNRHMSSMTVPTPKLNPKDSKLRCVVACVT